MFSSVRKEPHQIISGWASKGKYAGGVGASEVGEIKVCEFEDCSKIAIFQGSSQYSINTGILTV